MERKNVASGARWEPIVGYSRAVRVDAYGQAVHIFHRIEAALTQAGARLEDVVRTRIFLTNIDDWEKVGRAHAQFFRDVRPAATLLEVSRLIDPEVLVEIEADAVLASPLGNS